ncbi:MAG TPA: RNA polymerase sigma factor RpoD/SigA, partial [Gemmatimonadales bacterium]|nr:RNA polymerase sigma factor RpoD/SigA [Gemmatimonadales bacterium]
SSENGPGSRALKVSCKCSHDNGLPVAPTGRAGGWNRSRTVAVTKRTGGRRRSARAAQLPKAIDEGRESLDFYLQEISRIPLLKIEEETALARRAFKGDVEAQEKLARHNVRFVVSVAKKFQNRGVPLMDLIGEGNLGLMTAARKFDPDRGVKFISYAVWWIRQAIQAAIARHGRPVRLPLNRTADLSRLGRVTTLLTEQLGRVPTTEELVKATGLTPEAVRSLGALHVEALRLDQPVREGEDRGRLDRFVPLTQEGTDAATLASSRTDDLEAALAALPPRDAKVLRLYFGLDDGNSRTLEEIGRMMGVTRERIRQLRDRALRQLKEEHGDKLRELAA